MSRLLLAVLLCALPSRAFAWPRQAFEDQDVVTRSEVIAVAHLKPGSVQYVPHPGGGSWEHHATLVIVEVIAGHAAPGEVPIIIHYGLDPLLEGKLNESGHTVSLPGAFAKGSIQILDSGSSAISFTPVVADATQDHLWFLRRRSGIYGREPGTGNLGIVDPEDVRPLDKRAYLALYLHPDAEIAITAWARTHDEPSASRWLDHLEVQRLAKLADPARRVEKLLPYFERGTLWGLHAEAEEAILAAGADASGPRLLARYATAKRGLRESIVDIWGRTHFRGAVDTLVAQLDAADRFWAVQQLAPGWWNVDSPITTERRERYSDVYEAVVALERIGDPRAKPAIERTLVRWKKIAFDNPQIVESCEAALGTFAK
jgi:hypothetical protein